MESLIDKRKPNSLHILLVEDSYINQKVAVKILEKQGYNIDVADNGLEAIKALSLISYDLVLMDCFMPQMDGYEATREIRRLGSSVLNHDILIIAITSSVKRSDLEQCIKAGMDDFLSKPFKPEDFLKMLEKWL